MPNEFFLSKLFRDAFGYEAPKSFTVPTATARKNVSDLGQPYYGTDALGREHFLPVYLNKMLLPFAVIGISPKKTLVETPMPERGGSVIEIVSIDSYAINIKGILISDDNNFPEKEMMELEKLFKINASVELRSAITDIWLRGGTKEDEKLNDMLHQVVIKEIPLPPVAGVEHAKPFEINCVSDMIFTLEIE